MFRDTPGKQYGTTVNGGDLSRCAGLGCGVIFRESPSRTLELLPAFGGPGQGDGADPTHAVLRDAEDNLYGTTENGGLPSCSNYEGYPVETLRRHLRRGDHLQISELPCVRNRAE